MHARTSDKYSHRTSELIGVPQYILDIIINSMKLSIGNEYYTKINSINGEDNNVVPIDVPILGRLWVCCDPITCKLTYQLDIDKKFDTMIKAILDKNIDPLATKVSEKLIEKFIEKYNNIID